MEGEGMDISTSKDRWRSSEKRLHQQIAFLMHAHRCVYVR
jgi:hypothetical protein